MSISGTKISFLILLLILPSVFWSCKKEENTKQVKELNVTVSNNEEYTYDFNFSGDEEGAKIVQQAEHYILSEIIRDTIDFSFIYHYIPEPGYTGTDYVEIETCTGGSGNTCFYKTTFEVNITVTF